MLQCRSELLSNNQSYSLLVAVFALLLDLVMLAVFLPYIKNFWNRCLTIKKVAHWIGIGLGTFFFIGYLISKSASYFHPCILLCSIYECAVVFGPTGTSMHEIVKQFPDTHPLKGTFDSAVRIRLTNLHFITFARRLLSVIFLSQ